MGAAAPFFLARGPAPARKDLPLPRKKMVFRRRYGLFYFLTFMSGARRQIFVVFAVFLLVEKFGFSVREVTLLFVLNNGVNYFLAAAGMSALSLVAAQRLRTPGPAERPVRRSP